jgi:hypothetical protein
MLKCSYIIGTIVIEREHILKATCYFDVSNCKNNLERTEKS